MQISHGTVVREMKQLVGETQAQLAKQRFEEIATYFRRAIPSVKVDEIEALMNQLPANASRADICTLVLAFYCTGQEGVLHMDAAANAADILLAKDTKTKDEVMNRLAAEMASLVGTGEMTQPVDDLAF